MSEFDPQQLSLPQWKRALRRAFPERHVMIRTDTGGFQSWTLGSLSQAVAAVVGVIMLGVVTYSVAMVIWVDAVIDAKTAEVQEAQDSYKQLLAEVALYRDQVAAVTRSLEDNTAVMARYVGSEDTPAPRQRADAAAGDDGAATWQEEAGRARDALLGQLAEMEAGMAELSEAHQLLTRFDDFELEMRKTVLQRDLALEENQALTRRVNDLEDLVIEMETAQAALLDHFGAVAQTRIADIEGSLAEVGLDIDSMLEAMTTAGDGDGKGGPFVPADLPILDKPVLKESVTLLNTHVDRLDALRDLTEHLPLTRPVLSGYRLSSPFGVRRDPINGRLARHEGQDFSAPPGTPVVAPAAGKVVYAGWRGRYGRTIEISHGLGLTTLYAHLSKITVETGESVSRGDLIGQVGNSGRSTGPHLHYEIRVKGTPRNPAKFMKAGQHVFPG
ncbi:M23 family metallopeptidase [Roseospira goensis]|uniref:Murein DD-endopeptidase MepM/ murein hydrolase activator NlpD n=1 Tax=Roseospira goensis TaxID=391922 RepID=A0A7W6RYK3_9PROT|nr:M23 family metallopeptidase [Roseospira goensis]MBB4284964.1 murein DD-endopeptidase MepM/ murein hydrolase activator NlpD [Roseospira goensis]